MSQEARFLIAAALSVVVGSLVLPNPPISEKNPSNINYYELNLRKSHLIGGSVLKTKYSVVTSGSEEIFVRFTSNISNLSLARENILESSSSIHLPLTSTVQELKSIIQARQNLPSLDQELIFNGQILKDHLTLIECNIKEGSVIELNVVNNRREALKFDDKMTLENDQGGSIESIEKINQSNGKSIAYINPIQLHPQYDYDFSYMVDHKKYYRGGLKYRRPCSWKRFALRVLNKYESNIWLGVRSETNENDDNLIYTRKSEYTSVPNEWPVSYHATGTLNDTYTMADIGNSKLKTDFKFLGKRIMNKLFFRNEKNMKKIFTYGRGIYTTPNIYVAVQFASRFEFDGVKYLVLFQNRVNPNTLVKVGDYWISPKAEDVRTYGICIKRDPYQK